MIVLAINFLVVLLISFAIFAKFISVANAAKAQRTRLETIHVSQVHEAALDKRDNLLTLQRVDTRGRVAQQLQRFPFTAGVEKLLLHANSHMTLLSFTLASAASALAAGLLCWVFAPVGLLEGLSVSAGLGAPYAVLRWQSSRRVNAFNQSLPDALDLMTRALRAGHAMSSAIELLALESPAPLGPEFASVFQQQKLGVRFRDAMLEMADRIPSRDLHFVITAILVQRETGGDITEILDRTTYVIRERARIEADVRARTAQGKLTGWILGLLPVAMLLLLNLISPGYSHLLFHDPTGQKMLYAGAGFIVIGAIAIRKIVDVQV